MTLLIKEDLIINLDVFMDFLVRHSRRLARQLLPVAPGSPSMGIKVEGKWNTGSTLLSNTQMVCMRFPGM